jgi:2-polyprenyl-3-methyl-5-hydroxy-6-metoxy-1,4-benzoquinol methylase
VTRDHVRALPFDQDRRNRPFTAIVTSVIRGSLDTPALTARIARGPTLIEGWALVDDHPADSVVITANGSIVGSARVVVPRPDVAEGFGDERLQHCGFAVSVDLSAVRGDSVRLAATTFVNADGGPTEPALVGEVVVPFALRATPRLDEDALCELANEWWYYSVELLPGLVARGIDYEHDIPLLPRMLMRSCALSGMDCLDLGSMEGLIPVLMTRQGARSVLATDFENWLADKVNAVKFAYDADFDFQSVGLMYDLHRKLSGRSFDFINCSGLLYHVWSPLHVLSGVRPLLKRHGLMIVSTIVNLTDDRFAEFNRAGMLNGECNTFWYLSAGMLEYMLWYLRLQPIKALGFVHGEHWRGPGDSGPNEDRGYVSVLCRAIDASEKDAWMRESAIGSIEYQLSTDWAMANSQPVSDIALTEELADNSGMSLLDAIRSAPLIPKLVPKDCTGLLRLSDTR